ncbi:cadherin-89D isoform X3 [Microplitis demolitor]|uniref:cadherin-89D isoform X3 n=1 Tax=Microplitis demolitor TaxID=69319 RepID=UPI0004CCD366|nr:cadherin-89D isoform X3 [Microplitis demolitor]
MGDKLLPKLLIIKYILWGILINKSTGCQFYPLGEYLKFVRVPENFPLGAEVLSLEIHPRSHLTIMPIDKDEDARYFAYKDINATHISVILAQSLEELVDSEIPRNLLKFRFVCDYSDGANSLTSSHLSVTVYVEDINDHAPQFIGTPYHVFVDEFTPPGMTIFRGINAFDGDKPNTPNSDVHYAIVKGNEEGKFSLESGHRTALILRKPLDYDAGDRLFSLIITATDRGVPAKSSNTTVTINVRDNDDLGPKFTNEIYKGKIYESYPFTRDTIHQEISLQVPIHAEDQDRGINTPVKYSIVSGNERGLFQIDSTNGSIFLKRAIDLDTERLTLPNNTFTLQIHASQLDNPLKYSFAKVLIEIIDLNDNLPEFEQDHYNISIVENLPNGFSVLQVVAHDRDQGENADFYYQLDDESGAFAIDGKSGWLTVKDERVLDRERISLIRMKVYAVEKNKNSVVIGGSSGVEKLNSSAVFVQVSILDANDNNPIFVPTNIYEFMTRTNAKVGTVLGKVHAVDSDLGRNGVVRYGIQQTGNSTTTIITSTLARVPFAVEPRTGAISVAETPIIEGRHAIFVEATDQPANPSERRFSLAVVTVDVFPPDDTKDLKPDFVGAPYEFWVGANVAVGTSVGQIRINDAAQRKNAALYDLLHSYHDGVPFAVEEQTGTITVIDEIERYQRKSYEFEGVVSNDKDLTLVTNVSINVVDPNDNRELFTKGTTRAPLVYHVKENMPSAFIGQVLPRNTTRNVTRSLVRFLIANQRDVPDIAITEDGDLYTVRGLDREIKQNYSITVIAETTRGLGIFQVTIIVDDINDNPPIFDMEKYQGHLTENSVSGTEVILDHRVSVHDADEVVNSNFNLTLEGDASDLFSIDSTTGRVFFTGHGSHLLDRENKSTYMLRIIASDDINKKSTALLQINLDDVNDNPPTFVQMIVSPDYGIIVSNHKDGDNDDSDDDDDYIFEKSSKDNEQRRHSPLLIVPENITIGTVIIRLLAQDKDNSNNAKITYSIANETIYPPYLHSISDTATTTLPSTTYFIINPRSGELSVARTLPVARKVYLNIIAADPDNLTDHVIVRMKIVDVNDHPPVFKKSWYAFDIMEGVYNKYKIGKIIAEDLDQGNNAKINYKIDSQSSNNNSRFQIGETTGILTVTGNLDREKQDNYQIVVIGYDNGSVSLSSSVDVEINILDANDNSPQFYGFVDFKNSLPIYYTSVAENTPIGTVIHRVYANDSDFVGNGNGLILFDLPNSFHRLFFTIDSKDGTISTIKNLDYENLELHNVTLTVRDLGSPSLTSTAMLYVRVLDVDEPLEQVSNKPAFQHRYYEVEVEENSLTPLKLLELNVTDYYSGQAIKYEILSNDSQVFDFFYIDPNNGTLFLINSVDREYRDSYEFKVKVDRKTPRGLPTMIYPIQEDKLMDLRINEAKIVVRVKDINDNAPKFKSKGRPLLAAVPASANYGYEIIRVEAEDIDEGINGEIRYKILGRQDAPRFAIDPLSGQVRSVGSFTREAGRVFGFDVKATDRRGADNGRSSIANVFVYVVDDNKQVVMVMGRKPTEIENQVEDITGALKNLTGLDVRVRKLEPHIEKNLIDTTCTDVYLYAVDPDLNVMVDMETLHRVFRRKKSEIKGELERYRVLEITGNTPRNNSSQRYLLSTLEVGVVVLSCVIFIGALVAIICVICIRRNKRRGHERTLGPSASAMFSPVGFALAEPTATTLRKPASLFPTFVDGLRYDPEPFAIDTRRLSVCEHEPGCVHHGRSRISCTGGTSSKRNPTRGTPNGCLEASAMSLHSSGQDSGIVARNCHCGHSSTPSSGDSSNGYEDSLKSLHRSTSNQLSRAPTEFINDKKESMTKSNRRRHRFHSFSNAESSIYARNASLDREMRYRTETEKRHLQDRPLPEIHVSRTMIRQQPGPHELTQSMTRLNGPTGSSHSLFW